MKWRHLQGLKKQTNPQQALQPFLPLFLPLPSLDGHSCFRHGGRSPRGCLYGQRAGFGRGQALLPSCSGKGSKAPRDMAGSWDQHQDVNPSTGMPGSLSCLGYPKGIPHSLPAPVPAHPQAGRKQGQAGTASAKGGLCPIPNPCAECHTDVQLSPKGLLLLCTSLVPLADLVPKSCHNPKSHSSILP